MAARIRKGDTVVVTTGRSKGQRGEVLQVFPKENRAVVQGAGFAMRMKTADFLAECDKSKALSRLLRRFTHSLLTQASQSAICCGFHPIESRLARWLLMTSDRMETNNFHLTQEFLSNMLGVRREAVSKSAVILQQQQLITYSRGNISIVNRPALETKTCMCYALIKAEEINSSLY